MDCNLVLDMIFAVGRVFILVIGMFAGIFSIYLGWRLYADKMSSRTSGELTVKDFRLSLTAAGPGVFLALFGAYLLVAIVNRPLELSEQISRKSTSSAYKSTDALNPGVLQVQLSTAAPAASALQTPCSSCLVVQRRRLLLDGGEPLTPAAARSTLDSAITLASEARDAASDAGKRASLIATLSNLRELRAGVSQ